MRAECIASFVITPIHKIQMTKRVCYVQYKVFVDVQLTFRNYRRSRVNRAARAPRHKIAVSQDRSGNYLPNYMEQSPS
jgi:hypothetical protein